jgi:NAD(P)H-hydrate epimerase
MIPVVRPDEMRAIDAAAPFAHTELVERAGAAVAHAALRMLGGTYGRVVVVLAGPGSNGADGRVAARLLAARGVRVTVVDIERSRPVPYVVDTESPSPAHLVIDAVYGTGFRDAWQPPDVGDVPVLAVDIPSGVDAVTGEVRGGALRATRTVTFAALKPGLLFGAGRELCGEVEVVDASRIGLDRATVGRVAVHAVEASDAARWTPVRPSDAHKWRTAVCVIAGSPGMPGAAALVSAAAFRSGAGMVHVSSPHGMLAGLPTEAVQVETVAESELRRFGALVVGPGLGRSEATQRAVDEVLHRAAQSGTPVVLDGDALWAVASGADTAPLGAHVVVTPHDGEFERLFGAPVGGDRLAAATALSARLGCTVLLKGPTTVIATPTGEALVSSSGDERLATAGTGDVLAGMVGALLAAGADPSHASATAAWAHGACGAFVPRHGMMASDLIGALPRVWDMLAGERR